MNDWRVFTLRYLMRTFSVCLTHTWSHSHIHSQMLLVSYTNYVQIILWGFQLCQHSYCCTWPKNTQHSYHALFFLYKNKFYKNIEAQHHQRGWKFNGNLRINNGKVEAQGNFKYSYQIKRVYITTNSRLFPKWPWVHLPLSRIVFIISEIYPI